MKDGVLVEVDSCDSWEGVVGPEETGRRLENWVEGG